MSEALTKTDDVPAHVDFITLGEFADIREGAPNLDINVGSSVVFLVNESGTYKICNGRVLGVSFDAYSTQYTIMKRNGATVSHVNRIHVIAV